jgi:hypothetical protein
MQTLTQRKSPLTQQQREILATVINQCDEFQVTAEDIWTIRIDETVNVIWVHLYDGRQLPFDRYQFKALVAKTKTEIAPAAPVGMPIPQGLEIGEVYYRKHWVQVWKLKQRHWGTYGHFLVVDTSSNRIIGMVQSRGQHSWNIATERRNLYLGLAAAKAA